MRPTVFPKQGEHQYNVDGLHLGNVHKKKSFNDLNLHHVAHYAVLPPSNVQ